MVSKNALTFCTRRVALCLKSPNSVESKILVIINRQFLSAKAGWATILACTRLPGFAFYFPLLGKYFSSRQTGRGCGSFHNEYVHAKSLQMCLTLCNPTDYSPPGFSVHGTLQARILEWVAIPYLQGIFPTQGSNPCLQWLLDWRHIFYCWTTGEALSHDGNLLNFILGMPSRKRILVQCIHTYLLLPFPVVV